MDIMLNPFTVQRKETFRAKSVLKKKVFKIAWIRQYKYYWGRRIRIWSQNCKIQNGESNMADQNSK